VQKRDVWQSASGYTRLAQQPATARQGFGYDLRYQGYLQEYHKKRYDKVVKHNPEAMAKRAAYHAEWQRQNKDKLNAYQRERRRKKKESANG
jgi:hypothetical protein